MRIFQLQSDLPNQHCTLRHVVVTLEDDGKQGVKATISYLGVQDPSKADPKLAAITNAIKRNRFYVRALALSSATAAPAAAAGTGNVGSAVLFTLETEPQWFERGEVRFVRLECPNVISLRQYFKLVDRFEIEFRFE